MKNFLFVMSILCLSASFSGEVNGFCKKIKQVKNQDALSQKGEKRARQLAQYADAYLKERGISQEQRERIVEELYTGYLAIYIPTTKILQAGDLQAHFIALVTCKICVKNELDIDCIEFESAMIKNHWNILSSQDSETSAS